MELLLDGTRGHRLSRGRTYTATLGNACRRLAGPAVVLLAMDMEPDRREQNMARWTLAGSARQVLGPPALAAGVSLGPRWRALFAGFAAAALLTLGVVCRLPRVTGDVEGSRPRPPSLAAGLRSVLLCLRRASVLRWVLLLGLLNSGWYAILQAQLYAAVPGQSGVALAVKNVSGLVGSLIPLALGMAAQRLGLSVAMWLLLAGPVALLLGCADSHPTRPNASHSV